MRRLQLTAALPLVLGDGGARPSFTARSEQGVFNSVSLMLVGV